MSRANELSRAFRDAANRVLPATVKVLAYLQTMEERQAMKIQIPALRDWKERRLPGDSTGTGVLIDPRGIVLTNNHVIVRAKEIEVELPDGRRFFASKYRHDPETDLAVIWLDVPEDEENLPHAVFGDSDAMDIGDWVLAVGNPFELDSTVSAGIISAKGRSLRQIQRTEFLQTDAAINPGNSGGPLVNLQGEIIGINTAIASQTGAYQGVGFALPSNNARWVVRQILAKGKVERSWIGVVTKALTPRDARRLGVSSEAGVVVDYPVPGSPSEEAGLQTDDVILSFDGRKIETVHQLQRLAERAAIGETHRVVIFRDGKRYAAEIDAKPLPPTANAAAPMLAGGVQSYVDAGLGMLVVQATDVLTARLRMSGRKGMLVMGTYPEGRATKAGVQTGILIVKVDGKDVPTRDAYVAAREAGSLSDGITLDVVLPGGETRKIEIKLGR